MGKQNYSFEELQPEYAQLLSSMIVRPQWVEPFQRDAATIAAGREFYDAVEKEIGVPWYFTGAIHSMECGLSFKKHLHCGDPLTARTRNVPRGRPLHEPANGLCYTWHESALDALRLKGLDKITEWTPERVAYEAERYNGWGYRWYHPTTLSPYLWSGTNHYVSGKYVRDGVWSSSAVSQQTGLIPLMRALQGPLATAPTTTSVPVVELPKTAEEFANLFR